MSPEPTLIPCVYCNHANPPGHRFCGMCGKALPDLVKLAARTAVAQSPVTAKPVAPAPVAHKAENPNRDLSYLLHDDHIPARASRVPFVVGGLVLAAVALFFTMRGGGKPGASGTAAGDATFTQKAEGSAAEDAPSSTSPASSEPSKAETAKAEPVASEPAAAERKAEPEKATPSPAEAAPPVKEFRHAAAKVAPAPRPTRKPSPAKQV